MANTPSGDGGGGIDWRQFFQSEDGVFLDFGRIAEVGIGTIFGAFFTGATSLVLGVVDIPIALLGGFGDFLAVLVDVLVGVPTLILRGAWADTVPFILDAGIAGFVVALGIVLLTLYILTWGVNQIGG